MYTLSFFNPCAGEPLDDTEEGEQNRQQFIDTLNTVARCLSQPERQPAIHNFDHLTRYCIDCHITEVENANVPYGYGVECHSPMPITAGRIIRRAEGGRGGPVVTR